MAATSIHDAFISQNIAPSMIPAILLKVTFENDVEVNLGNKLQPRQVRTEPKYEWNPSDQNAMYSLVFIDPDAPSPSKPFLSEMIHHMVINIKGTDVSSGKVCSNSKGSGPPMLTGKLIEMMYIFLVYKQNDGEITDYTLKSKGKFKCAEFASKCNLSLEAGNFFLAAYDSSVLGTWAKTLIGK